MELPLPELGEGKTSMKASARDMQAKIRAQTPPDLRDSIRVTAFERSGKTGLLIEYDDKAENYVYMAMEYPVGGKREERIEP